MSSDGQIDYSEYSYRELLEALNNINSRKFPVNYANIQAALEKVGPAQRDALARQSESDPLPEIDSLIDESRLPPDVRRVNHLVTSLFVAGISAYLLWVGDLTLPFKTPLKIALSGMGETLGYLAFLLAVAVPASFVLDYIDHRDNRRKYLLFAIFAESAATGLIIFAAVVSSSPN